MAQGSNNTMGRVSKIAADSDQAMSIKYNTMVYELQRQGTRITVMSLGEAFFDIPLLPMDDLPFPQIYHYSDSRGIPEMREELARYFDEEYDVPIDPEMEIIVTAGSKAAIHMAFMAVLNPGDEVLIPEPAWVSHPAQVKFCYGVPVGVPYAKTTFELEEQITDRTKVIVINTPHNPRGYIYAREELQYLLELAARHDLWIFSDEAYSDFVLDKSFVSIGSLDREKRHAVVFNSVSKNFGISGWRLGYVIANPELTYEILKINQHLITCPATILEYYVAKHFRALLEITKPQIRDVLLRRQDLARIMDDLGLHYLPGAATFYFFVSIAPSRLSSEEFCTRLLLEDHVSTVPGLGYGKSCEGFIRVSVGTASLEENQEGLQKIKALIDRTS